MQHTVRRARLSAHHIVGVIRSSTPAAFHAKITAAG
jgi:hypothetical protein